jgi:hypothetical protein
MLNDIWFFFFFLSFSPVILPHLFFCARSLFFFFFFHMITCLHLFFSLNLLSMPLGYMSTLAFSLDLVSTLLGYMSTLVFFTRSPLCSLVTCLRSFFSIDLLTMFSFSLNLLFRLVTCWMKVKGLKEWLLLLIYHEMRGNKVQKKKLSLDSEPAIVIAANAEASLDIREQHLVKTPPK